MEIDARQFYWILTILALVLAACGTAQPMPDFNSFAHRVSDDMVNLYWNCSRPAPGVVRVAGVASNPYSAQPLQDVEFRLYGVNAQGTNVSRARGSAHAFLIYTNDSSPFTIDLKTMGGETRYDLVYSYRVQPEVDQNFALGTGGEAQNFARNICAGLGP